MRMTNLMIAGTVMLLAGIALALYGYYLQPTAGEAFSNIFNGDFTDKRNLFIGGGLVLAALGGISLAGAAMSTRRLRTSA